MPNNIQLPFFFKFFFFKHFLPGTGHTNSLNLRTLSVCVLLDLGAYGLKAIHPLLLPFKEKAFHAKKCLCATLVNTERCARFKISTASRLCQSHWTTLYSLTYQCN